MGFRRGKIDHGEMAEWSIAAVLKTVELRGSGGSNPSLSARDFKVTAKWSSEKPSKQEEIVVGHGLTTIFLCMRSIDLTAYP